ncbi:UDP-glucosyltransferase 2-like [Bactrocera dorsalis]|uniref:UDP-glucuronosyltransferase n=1 Tax=Bactrocera dorsalis TaxID=27457 RepID=A0ABM3J7C6_BACDO|nr:UDP-glucosyltransferase 2-like [Bactrocera dorsalis]
MIILPLIACVLISSLYPNNTEAANILIITLGGTKSHKIPFLALAHGLIPRGHQVTFVSGFKSAAIHKDLQELAPGPLVDYIQQYMDLDLVGARHEGKPPLTMWQALRYPTEVCRSFLSDTAIIHSLLSKSYDLAILDGAFPECALGLVHRLGVPFMYINTVGFYTGSLSLAGNPNVYAVTPHVFTTYTHSMDFLQRLQNVVTHITAELLHKYCTAQVHAVLQTHLGRLMPHPYILGRNVSFVLQNGHASVTYPRPYYPNVAEIACIHCRPANKLPQELEHFMSSAPAGVIYCSMGSSVRATNMPEEFRQILIRTFAKLTQYHVLWKWESNITQINNLPSNVRLNTWLPQQDILGHRRLKAFITHGGLLSMYEAIYHAVPVIMLPVFCDHDVNAAKAVTDGYTIQLALGAQLTAARLQRAIYDIIHNGKYRRAVRLRRALLLDQPMSPLETAIFWTEYTLRHRGAHHLQPPARDMR